MNKNYTIEYTKDTLSQNIGIDSRCIEQNISLAKKTWIHRGGIARWWLAPRCYDDLVKIGSFLYKENLKFDIIGHTSNIYFTNSYNPEFILDTKHVKNVQFEGNKIVCDAGFPISQLARMCVEKGISGYEGLIDLPGTVGAAAVNNSGCFNCEISKIVNKLDLLTKDGIIQLTNEELGYSHRNSRLKRREIQGIIVRVYLDASHKSSIEQLQTIATRNHEIRVHMQEKPSHNLGSTFAYTTLKRNVQYYIVMGIIKLLLIFRLDHLTKTKIQKQIYLILQRKRYLSPYISNKNLNTYLFLDEYADSYFSDYIKFIESIYEKPHLEIEIKR